MIYKGILNWSLNTGGGGDEEVNSNAQAPGEHALEGYLGA